MRVARRFGKDAAPQADAAVLLETAALSDRHGGVRHGALLGAHVTAMGHEVRLMPPSYVKAYVKRGKSDAPMPKRSAKPYSVRRCGLCR